MFRLFAHENLQIALGLTIALGIAATRTEKVLAEMQSSFARDHDVRLSSSGHALPAPFDPARVPQSGGMASRLLAGISVKFA